jgi:hypothetical protein
MHFTDNDYNGSDNLSLIAVQSSLIANMKGSR